jgi:hypothetical protein
MLALVTRRVAAASALALGAVLLTCRSVLSIDDKGLVDGAGGAAGIGGEGGDGGRLQAAPTLHVLSPSWGPPATTGCADATREGFLNGTYFPTIAGCAASWPTQNMRTDPTGAPCGNDLGPCATPADACAQGWHLCLLHGYPGDLTTRITSEACKPDPFEYPPNGSPMFVAASDQQGGHPCNPPLPLPCGIDNGWSITVCCGRDCYLGESSCVFPNARTPFGLTECGLSSANPPSGVLCCEDPEVMF